MKKSFLLMLFVSASAFAQVGDPEVVRIRPGTGEAQAIEILKSRLDPYANDRSKSYAFEIREPNRSYLTNYVNGDFVILWGVGESDKDQNITQKEYQGLWAVMNYLSNQNFRVVMNVRSVGEDLAEAFASPTSSVVVWSAHGNQGAFYDWDSKPVPYDVFKNISPNVYQVILSTCYGRQALENYPRPADLKVVSWDTTTTPTQLLNYLVSDEFNAFDGKKR